MTIASLGYLGFTSPNLEAWRTFGEVLGVEAVESSSLKETRFRLDERSWRIAVTEGPAETLAYIGFEVRNEHDFQILLKNLSHAGVSVDLSDELAATRKVAQVVATEDPAGNRVEFFYGASCDYAFRSPSATEFVTGDLGLGHVVFAVPNYEACLDFYIECLGFRVSDHFPAGKTGLVFLHCGRRHHSVALANGGGTPPAGGPTIVNEFDDLVEVMDAGGSASGLLHFMLEVPDLDRVGQAMDRATSLGVPMTQTLGRHTNDKMVSVYFRTPGGYEVEYGFGAITVDDAEWSVSTLEKPSLWGHFPIASK